jgi:cation diffusion facilitator family transporter
MNKTKAGYTEGIVSVLVNSLLFALKLWAGLISGSIALIADAWHTMSDSVSSVIVIIAVKLSSKKPDKKHPFGHGRWEQIAALIIAFILSIIAFNFLTDSIGRFNSHKTVEFGTISIVVTIISVVLKEALAQYAFYIAKKTDNLSVKADGWHHRSDALSSVVVLAGIIFSKNFWWIDSVLGMIIALILFYATFEIAKDAITKLLGEKPDETLINKITQTVNTAYDNDLQMHHFHIHNYVTHQELTFHIKLDNSLTIEKGHEIATDIENIIHEQMGIIATIHVEPMNFEHNTD